ncbi:hypothetical protein CLF_100108 [Clonorchis sinensis]|uniref:Uncharacterized protein n=1 Tax=Clonorchis sinensis TaxID=79923 RepID=G7Y2P2_CLOSI|nr:hypothetical protein CLF_100108 [Clonorchis sinensis]
MWELSVHTHNATQFINDNNSGVHTDSQTPVDNGEKWCFKVSSVRTVYVPVSRGSNPVMPYKRSLLETTSNSTCPGSFTVIMDTYFQFIRFNLNITNIRHVDEALQAITVYKHGSITIAKVSGCGFMGRKAKQQVQAALHFSSKVFFSFGEDFLFSGSQTTVESCDEKFITTNTRQFAICMFVTYYKVPLEARPVPPLTVRAQRSLPIKLELFYTKISYHFAHCFRATGLTGTIKEIWLAFRYNKCSGLRLLSDCFGATGLISTIKEIWLAFRVLRRLAHATIGDREDRRHKMEDVVREDLADTIYVLDVLKCESIWRALQEMIIHRNDPRIATAQFMHLSDAVIPIGRRAA